MTEQDIFTEKANSGYPVCYVEQCPLKEHCLRWLVGQQMPETTSFINCVNPLSLNAGTEGCPHYRNSEKVRFAKGMTKVFNADMPRRVEPYVRHNLIKNHCRTYYYEYRNGSRLISPTIQEEVRRLFREIGWNNPIEFDGYKEDYDW